MTGHRSFAALRERMSPTRRARNLRRNTERWRSPRSFLMAR
jgi:hypothetical protein